MNVLNFIQERFLLIVLFLFIFASFFGITGSSEYEANNWGLTKNNQKVLIGKTKSVRSDEWGVLTPLAVAQFKSEEQFPIVNKNVDMTGKNMLVIHDMGVPVLHSSALFKPATWGFFSNNLRFGLSWYWLCPIFIGFMGCVLIFETIFGKSYKNYIFSLCIVYSPICSAWSNSTLYQIGLAGISFYSFFKLLNEYKFKYKIIYTLIYAWASLSLVLTLYLPHIIPLIYLVVFISVGILFYNKQWRLILTNCHYIFASFAIMGLFLYLWYLDAKPGVDAILNSTYPGNRIVTGGSYSFSWMVKGWFPFQFVNHEVKFLNNCELSSFFSTIPFVISYIVICFKYLNKNWLILLSLAFFWCIARHYQLLGFNESLAKYSFWGKTHEPRVEPAIMLAEFLMLRLVAKSFYDNFQSINKIQKYLIFVSSFTIFVFMYYFGLIKMPSALIDSIFMKNGKYVVITLSIFAMLSFWFICNKHVFLCLLLLSVASSGFLFNPISIAADRFDFDGPADLLQEKKVIFVTGSPWASNTGYAAGLSLFTGVHHYVDQELYNSFYSKLSNAKDLNKFNHLSLIADTSVSDFKIESFGDVINWYVNPVNFDFSHLGSDIVVVYEKDQKSFSSNRTLKFLENQQGYSYFEILNYR